MRGSGGNESRFVPGMGVHVDDGKEVTTGREKLPGKGVKLTRGEREVCVSHCVICEGRRGSKMLCGEGGTQA